MFSFIKDNYDTLEEIMIDMLKDILLDSDNVKNVCSSILNIFKR